MAIAIGALLVGVVSVYYWSVTFPGVPTRVVIDMDGNVTIDTRAAKRGEVRQGRLPTRVPIFSKFRNGTEVLGYYWQEPGTDRYSIREGKQPHSVHYVFGKWYELAWTEDFLMLSHASYVTDPSKLRGSITNEVEIKYFPRLRFK